jgi:hypothetical protein
MFKCEICGTLSMPGERPVTLVTETRDAEYPARDYVAKRGQECHDAGGYGTEIVREIRAHAKCAEAMAPR